jgi:hypothetical protein
MKRVDKCNNSFLVIHTRGSSSREVAVAVVTSLPMIVGYNVVGNNVDHEGNTIVVLDVLQFLVSSSSSVQ